MSSTEPDVRSASTGPDPLRTAEEARDLLNQLERSTWTLAAFGHLVGSGDGATPNLDPHSADDEAAVMLARSGRRDVGPTNGTTWRPG